MILCINCGVELEDGLEICPLCGKDPKVSGRQENPSFNYPSAIIQLYRKEIRESLWELTGIIAFSAIAVCTIVDLTIIKGLGWSLYSDVAIAVGWIIFTLFLHAYRKPLVIFPGFVVTILAGLFAIDLIDPGREWFFDVAFPLAISAFAATEIIIILYRIANLKGLNIIAAAFIVLSGFCVLTELILDEYHAGFVNLRWSLIAGISILPVSLILFFYHYRLKRGNLLDSFFHI